MKFWKVDKRLMVQNEPINEPLNDPISDPIKSTPKNMKIMNLGQLSYNLLLFLPGFTIISIIGVINYGKVIF